MKRIIAAIVAMICLTVCICGMAADEQPVVRLGGLKGPTSMGMVKLLDDAEKGLTVNQYEFTMAGSADELTPRLLKGELDILAVPANLAAILYNNTQGKVRFLAVNTLGVLYILEKGSDTIQSIADLAGKTIIATGKGSTPEFALRYLLASNGLIMDEDVFVDWRSEPTEAVALISTMDSAIVMLPQPFVTVAQTQVEGLRVAIDMTKEWDDLGTDGQMITAGLIVRSEFAEENPDVIRTFLEEYKMSTQYVNENIEEAAQLVEKYGIVKAVIAKKAIPYCNIVYMDGEEMTAAVSGYYQVLFSQNPASVGGAIPDDVFYYVQ